MAQATSKLCVGREPDSYFGSCQVTGGKLLLPAGCSNCRG